MNHRFSPGDGEVQCIAATPSPMTDTLAEQLAYWRQQLADLPLLALPTDQQRQPLVGYCRGQVSFLLSERLLAALQAVSYQEDTTLFITLLTGFLALLARYSGQEDLAVCTAGINGAAVLVVRPCLSGTATLREALGRVREVTLGAYTNSGWAFDVAAAEQSQHRPLVQAAFALQHTPNEIPLSEAAFGAWAEASVGFDVDMSLTVAPEGMAGTLAFDAHLFAETTMQRMADHYSAMLEAICTAPEQAIQQVRLLSEVERQQLLVEWNATVVDYPRQLGVHQLFEAQVERTPAAIAVMDEQVTLTYRELNEEANRLAFYLRKLGVGQEVLVGISLERSVWMLVGLLAILKAGGAYVPLDPNFPAERLAYMAENAQIPVLLTQEHVRTQIPVPEQVQVVCIDSDRQRFAQQNSMNPDASVALEQLAYVLYTSGSTGKPKGVQISQQALVNFLCSMQQEPGLHAWDTLLAVTTLSFDIAGLELFLPILVGARVYIASREIATSGVALSRTMEQVGATMLQATPVSWRLLLNSGWQGKADLVALCGGEALPRDLGEQLIPRVKALYNMYGPTETTVWSTVWRMRSMEGTISIGRPIANTQVYVLDADLQPVPIGVPGELYIGGDSVARGYLHRPELTEERFLADPFRPAPNASIYRTGDLARFLPNGTLEHLGRLDHQVKIRGFRIELGEIEAVLHQHAAVKDGVVMAREDVPGEKRLVAYVIPAEVERQLQREAECIAELRDFLRSKLPDYMVPAVFALLEILPLTPNGKVNRQALPAPKATTRRATTEASGKDEAEYSRPPLATAYGAPRSEVEQTIVTMWQECLGIAPVGIHDHFDELGGDSLQSFQIIARLYTAFEVQLSIKEFPATATIAGIANTLNEKLEEMIDPDVFEALLAEMEEES